MNSPSVNEHSHQIECEACGCEGEIVITGLMDLSDALPQRWKRRIINYRAYLLCDVCGHPRQFLKGISPYILDRLDLPPNATCEIEERDDFTGPKGNNQWNKAARRARRDAKKS